MITGRRPAALADAVNILHQRHGTTHISALTADVTNEAHVAEIFSKAPSTGRPPPPPPLAYSSPLPPPSALFLWRPETHCMN